MPKYKVGIFEEQGGYIIIKAKTKAQAREKAFNYVDENGMDFKKVDITHRDVSIVDEPKLEK